MLIDNMRHVMKGVIKTVLLVSALLISGLVFSQELQFPTPTGNPNQLFFLQRTPNLNTIVCELNYKNGVLEDDEPVHTFWIRYGEQGQRAELSYIQRKFAYGVKSNKLAHEKWELYFAGYKKYKMTLMRGTDSKYHVYANVNNKQIILSRIFVKINGGSFWSPNVEYVELKGIEVATGKEVAERMKI